MVNIDFVEPIEMSEMKNIYYYEMVGNASCINLFGEILIKTVYYTTRAIIL